MPNGKKRKSLQEIIEDYKNLNAQKSDIREKVGMFREQMVELALIFLKEERVVRNFTRWPRWSQEDLAGSDFQIFYANDENEMASVSISVLGPKYEHLEKIVHPNVDLVLPIAAPVDSVKVVMEKIKELLKTKKQQTPE